MISTMADGAGVRPHQERRRHLLFLTRNTEYHTRDGVVVAVRHLGAMRFSVNHPALGLSLVRQHHSEGERLWLTGADGQVLVTTQVVTIARPPRSTVLSYPVDITH